jgi:hypothetical protein
MRPSGLCWDGGGGVRSKVAMLPNVNICCGHRHLSNIDCLTAHTACLVCFTSTVNGHSKKRSLGRQALVVGA